MSSIRARVNQWIFHSYAVSPEGLGLYRIAYALFALLIVAPGHGEYASFSFLGTLPDAFFLPPPGPMGLASGFPDPVALEVLTVLLVVSLVALLFGWHTRPASIATTGLLLVGYGFSYSLGKINHNLLFVLLPACMAASNWGAAYSLDARSGRSPRAVAAWPLSLVTLLTGFAMFTAGFAKVLGGWLNPFTQATQGHVARQVFVHGRRDLLAPWALSVDEALLWELLDVATVAFEVGFLVAILHPATTRLFAAGAILFHTGVMLTMNIAFVFNFIVYAAVFPWARLAAVLRGAVRLPRVSLPSGAGVGLVLATSALAYVIGSPVLWLNEAVAFTSDLTVTDLLAVLLAWTGVLAGTLLLRKRTRYASTG